MSESRDHLTEEQRERLDALAEDMAAEKAVSLEVASHTLREGVKSEVRGMRKLAAWLKHLASNTGTEPK